LSLCHEVDDLAERIREFSSFPLRDLHERKRRALVQIRKLLKARRDDRFSLHLRELGSQHGLEDQELLILLMLFNRRVRRREPAIAGRDLLETLARTGGDVIEAARFLHPESALVEAGLVSSAALRPEDALDSDVRISDRAYASLYRTFHDLGSDEGIPEAAEPYGSAAEHLLDLRRVCDAAKRRAGKLFPQSAWAEAPGDDDHDPAEITAKIGKLRAAVLSRERATPESVRLPLVKLRAEFGLSEDDELIILTLLQHELFSAQTTIELVELARLIAPSEQDVFARRSIVAPEGRLRQSGLICVEDDPAGKDAFGAAWLPGWLTERLLGNLDPKGAIRSEEKSSFRQYLERLRDSDDFYRRL